jgi:CIC family chloride channel protein
MALRLRWHALSRNAIRNDDLGLVIAAALIGAAIGLGVALIRELVAVLHHVLFGVRLEEHLSDDVLIEPLRIVLVPALGGLLYGGIAYVMRRWRPRDIVDAIEANALYGGRMSFTDSLRLTLLTILSVGVGGSVGLEAAYTQFGAGLASWLGQALRLRRTDLRTFVGCGAAAAIGAVFNAPLAGAFYAFELIVGSYTLGTLAPIGVAALTGVLVERQLFGAEPIFIVYDHTALFATDYVLLAGLGILSAGLGIAAMVGVTVVEDWCRRISLPTWARPAAGGLVLGILALLYPQILGSGHGGIVTSVTSSYGFPILVGLIVAKLTASALSIGSGFRGGMFSSSLFLGSLFGSGVAVVLGYVVPWLAPHPTVLVLGGMGAVATAVVGAPVTMILLVLESTSDFPATIGVTTAVILASFTVRHWFGYSFATWRFHVRGVGLRSAHDVGWLQDLVVGKVMRREVATAPTDITLRRLRELFPLGAMRALFLVDQDGRYAGIVDTQEAHTVELDEQGDTLTAADIAHAKGHFLTPDQPVREALDLFVASEAETLAVVDNRADRHTVGFLTEAYALRRYSQELEARRGEDLGESELFGPSRAPTKS